MTRRSMMVHTADRFSLEAQDVFAEMVTQPSVAIKRAMNKFINSQVASGNWSSLITFKTIVDSNAANALIDWKGLVNATLGGSPQPTFNQSYGFETDGTQNFIKWGLIPSTHLTKNDNIVGSYLFKNIKTVGGVNPMLFGASRDTLRRLRVYQATSAVVYQEWDTTVTNYNPGDSLLLLDNNLYSVVRQDSANKSFYVGGTQVGTAAVASQSDSPLLDYEIYGGAQNGTTVNTATNFYDGRIGCFFAATFSTFDIDNFYQNLMVYYQDIGIYFKPKLANRGTTAPGGSNPIRVLQVGDSIGSGTSNGTGSATANTLYEWKDPDLTVVAAGTDIIGANTGSPYPAMANRLFSVTGRVMHLVEVAVGGSDFTQERDALNHTVKGSILATLFSEAQSYLVAQNAQKFDIIRITCGLNDARGVAGLSFVEDSMIELIEMLNVMFPNTTILINKIHSKSSATAPRVSAIRGYADDLVTNFSNVHAGKDLDDFLVGDYYDNLHLTQAANNALGIADADNIIALL
jgi:hypothetical protein